MSYLGYVYNSGLHPNSENITEIIYKFKVIDYDIPTYIAERYLTWFNMRTVFYTLHYMLTLISIVASLMTVFYAAYDNKKDEKNSKRIVFLSLISTCFTMASIFINAGSMANMSQHAWRALDNCIMQTINRTDLSKNEKDQILAEKVIELEQYIETYEH